MDAAPCSRLPWSASSAVHALLTASLLTSLLACVLACGSGSSGEAEGASADTAISHARLAAGEITAPLLSIHDHVLQSEVRVDSFRFDFVYTARCHSGGGPLHTVTAVAHSTSPHTEVIEGSLRCVDVPASGSAESVDTFTIRHDRRHPFDPESLDWVAVAFGPEELVSEERIDATRFRFVYRVVWSNQGDDEAALVAMLSSTDAETVVDDGLAQTLVPGGSSLAGDTFSIVHDRTFPFDPSALVWTLGFGAPQDFALGVTRTLDGLGHPLGGVTIEELGPGEPEGGASSASATGAQVPTVARTYQSETDSGIATLAQERGTFRWRFSTSDHLPVWRQRTLDVGDVALVESPWLSLRSADSTLLTLLNGGVVGDPEGWSHVRFAGGVFDATTEATLTEVGPQSLPAPLPPGWSPLNAFWLELEREPREAGTALLRPLDTLAAGESAVFARLDTESLHWIALELATGEGAEGVEVAVPGSGAYALVVGDAPPTAPPDARVGEALGASASGFPDARELAASGRAVPAVSPASVDPERVTARAELLISHAGPLPSGLVLRAEVDEVYALRDGSQQTEPRYQTFFVAYQRPGDANASTLHARFPLRPRRLLDVDVLDEAALHVEVVPVSEFAGAIFDAGGGQVASPAVVVTAPAGAVDGTRAVELRALEAERFADLAPGASPVAAFELLLDGVLSGARFATDFGLQAPDAHFVLARVLSVQGIQGLQPRERFASDASGRLASAEPAEGERLPGVTGAGQYVLVQVTGPQGLVTGVARDGSGDPAAGLVVRISGRPWLTLSDSAGAYRLVAPSGDVEVLALDPRSGDSAVGATALDDPPGRAALDIAVAPAGPRVVALDPADGSTGVDPVTPIRVRWSEPVAASSVGPDALVLRDASGVRIDAVQSLSLDRSVATLLPTDPLVHAESYQLEVDAAIRDDGGLPLEGQRLFGFSTEAAPTRGQSAQLIGWEPGAQTADCADVPGFDFGDDTISCVVGTAGTADPEVPVILVNETTGETGTVLSKPDGSFKNFIRAEVDDFLAATFVNATGTRIRIPQSRQNFDDGSVALFPGGGILEAESDGGPVQVLIEPGAVSTKSKFSVEALGLGELLALLNHTLPVDAELIGTGLKVQVSGDAIEGEGDFRFPVDPEQIALPEGTEPEDGAYVLAAAQQIDGATVFQVVDKMVYADGELRTNTFPFLGALALLGTVDDATTVFNMLLVPLAIGNDPVVVTGRVFRCPSDPNGKCQGGILPGVQTFLSKPVRGAFVTLSPPQIDPVTSLPGRLSPGTVYGVSDENGRYALVAGRQLGEYVLRATHPRFSRTAAAPVIGLLDFKIFRIVKDLFFVSSTNLVSTPPRLSVAHDPYLPAPGQVAAFEAIAFHTTGPPSLSVAVDRVDSLVPGETVSTSDVSLDDQMTTDVDAQRKKLTATISTDKALIATLRVRSWTSSSSPTQLEHTVVFGGTHVPGATNLVAPDANDEFGPRVVEASPREGAHAHSDGEPIVIEFDEPIDSAVLDQTGVVTLAKQGATVQPPGSGSPNAVRLGLSLSDDQRLLTIVPSKLERDQDYTLEISAGVLDLSGNPLDQEPGVAGDQSFVLNFTTAPELIFKFPGIERGGGVALRNNAAYVLERMDGDTSVVVFDVSNPTNPLEVATVPLPGPPRDVIVIPDYSYVIDRNTSQVIEGDLLVVVGGNLGTKTIDAQGNVFIEGQYLRVYDIRDPTNPQRLASPIITQRPSAVTKVRWKAPRLAYYESGSDLQQIGIIDLQTLLIGFNIPATQLQFLNTLGDPGEDANGDGDYTDPDDRLPVPRRNPPEFFGKIAACTLENTSQRMLDFDFDLGFCGVTLTEGKVLFGPDAGTSLPTGYRTLLFSDVELDRDDATTGFNPGARPKRVSTFFDVPLEVEDPNTGEVTIESKIIALVSLSPDSDDIQKLAVLDITLPESPEILRIIPFDAALSLGVLQSVSARSDGLLALATTTDVVLLDPALLAKENPTDPTILHPAIAGFLRGTGSGHISLSESREGVNLVNLGGRSQVVQTAPELSFVYFPTLAAVVEPKDLVDKDDEIAEALDAMLTTQSIVPARYRDDGGATKTLEPPAPQVHYHVLVRAPGGAGDEIKIALESLNRSGHALNNLGRDFPPVRAMTSETLMGLKQTGRMSCDAAIEELVAHRLSSEVFSPYHNLYLSDPIALSYERLSSSDLTTIHQNLDRAVLWSGYWLRASLDPEESSNVVLGPFASEVNTEDKILTLGTNTVAKTLPSVYVLGKNPPPAGGRVDAPGSFGHVAAHNGEVRIDTTDISLPSRRMPIQFTRSYGGQDLYEGAFGRGWDFNYNQRLIALDGDVFPPGSLLPLVVRQPAAEDTTGASRDLLFQTGTGGVVHFEFAGDQDSVPSEVSTDPLIEELGWDADATAFYLPVRGSFDVIMSFAVGEFVRLTPDGTQYWYGPRGKLQRVYDRHTENQHRLTYNGRGELTRIDDHSVDSDRFIEFGYHRFEEDSYYDSDIDEITTKPYIAGKVARIRDYAGRDVEYLYNDDGMLEHRDGFELAGDNGGFSGRPRTTYQADQSCGGNLQAVVEGNGTSSSSSGSTGTPLFSATLTNTMEQPTVSSGDGAGGRISYTAPTDNSAAKVGSATTKTVGPDDSKTDFEFDDYGYPKKMMMSGRDAAQADVETVFTEDGLIEKVTHPEGNTLTYVYDDQSPNFRSRGNLLSLTRDPGTRPGTAMTATYSSYDGKYNQPDDTFTDFDGNTITLTLDTDGLELVKRSYGSADADEYEYNDFGQLERFESAEGVVLEYEYDADDGFITKERRGDNETILSYDTTIAAKLGRATTEDRPEGADIVTVYDERLMPTKITRDTYVEKWAYDENGNLTLLEYDVEPNKTREERRTYNQIGFLEKLVIKSIEVDGTATDLTTTFEPDDAWRVKAINRPGGIREVYDYDHLGHLIKLTRGSYTEDYELDLHGNLLELTRGDDVVAEFDYDGFDRLVEIRRKLGGTAGDEKTTFEYFNDGATKKTEIIDPVEGLVYRETVNTRDARGRVTKATYSGDDASPEATTTYTKRESGGYTVRTSTTRSSSSLEFDSAGWIEKKTTPLATVDFELDGNGKVKRIDSEEDGTTYWESFTFDDLEHTLTRSDGVGRLFDFAPRRDGFNKSFTNGRSMTTTLAGSKLGELTQRKRPSGVEFNYEYEESRRISAIEDKNRKGRSWEYDDTFRTTKVTYRDGSETQLDSPDGRNRPKDLVIPGGSVTADYDLQGRLTSETIHYGSQPPLLIGYRYDALDRLREATYGGDSTTYSYDTLGPLRKVEFAEHGLVRAVSSEIYIDHTRKSVTYPSGAQVTEQRGTDGRIFRLSVSGAGGGLDGGLLDVSSFAGDAMIDTAELGGVIRMKNHFDLRRRMTATRFTRIADGGLLGDFRYRYVDNHNPSAVQRLHDSGRADFVSIDADDRITGVSVGARPQIANEIAHLPPGLPPPDAEFTAPRWRRSYSYDAGDLDLLTGSNSVNPDGFDLPPFADDISGHDAFLHGRMVDYPGVAPGFDRAAPDDLGSTAKTVLYVRDPGSGRPAPISADLEYDGKARLTRVSRADGVTIDFEYRYDHQLKRRTVRRNGAVDTDLAYIWDRDRIIEVYDASRVSSIPLARFYYADQDAPIAADLDDGSGGLQRYYYLRDHAQSIVAVADSSGNVVERVHYDAWGQPDFELRDVAPPTLSRVVARSGDVLLEFSEPVTPPLTGDAAGEEFVTTFAALSGAFVVEDALGPVAGTIRFEEDASGLRRGAVLRFSPSTPLAGSIGIRLAAGAVQDAWRNPNPDVVLAGLSFVPDGSLHETLPAPATAPERVARSSVGSPYLFHGQLFDYEAGLSYMRSRFYDPATGSFLQRDPEGYLNSPNLYGAFANNPVTHRDPSGRGVLDGFLRALKSLFKREPGPAIRSASPRSLARGSSPGVPRRGDAATQSVGGSGTAAARARTDRVSPSRLGGDGGRTQTAVNRNAIAQQAQTRHGLASAHSARPDSTVEGRGLIIELHTRESVKSNIDYALKAHPDAAFASFDRNVSASLFKTSRDADITGHFDWVTIISHGTSERVGGFTGKSLADFLERQGIWTDHIKLAACNGGTCGLAQELANNSLAVVEAVRGKAVVSPSGELARLVRKGWRENEQGERVPKYWRDFSRAGVRRFIPGGDD